jgi:hypothetical protein
MCNRKQTDSVTAGEPMLMRESAVAAIEGESAREDDENFPPIELKREKAANFYGG